ncbi:MAG: isoprenylcysteine carboxylmethyltransferase family protein [Thermodesulfobacteriota bacterium]
MNTFEKTKTPFWAAWFFYLLIGFEIIYMITPFGLYYYSIYSQGLNFLNDHPGTAWLSSFFLPHLVRTSSSILNISRDLGWVLALLGAAAFLLGAGQVYYHKFTRRGAVMGGIYKYIRHPQYLALSVLGFGLLLAWPRVLVLILYVTMLFVYYFLARAEEAECETKFGATYLEYKKKTGMFLPFRVKWSGGLRWLPRSGPAKTLAILAIYLLAVAAALGLAEAGKSYSLNRLYASYTGNSATIALIEIEPEKLAQILKLAQSDREVARRLGRTTAETKMINYVLPAEWYESDLPLRIPEGLHGHHEPGNYNRHLFKILITRANLAPGDVVQGRDIIRHAVKRIPLAEVWVDLSRNVVTAVEDPPATVRWGDIPTPLF